MSKRKVLLIVEGQKSEVELFEKIFAEFELGLDYEIYSYSTNIYDLYERMFANEEPGTLSLLGVLRETADESYKHLFDYDYSDVLLVFDYDPHDDRFTPERLEKLQAYFCESTDEGKLYINYPMVEACKHFDEMPDHGYLERCVRKADIPNYKKIVGSSAFYQSLTRNVGKYDLSLMVALVVTKACRIADPSIKLEDVSARYYALDHLEILKQQNRLYNSEGIVSVLGTSLLFVADYSSELSDLSWAIRDLFDV